MRNGLAATLAVLTVVVLGCVAVPGSVETPASMPSGSPPPVSALPSTSSGAAPTSAGTIPTEDPSIAPAPTERSVQQLSDIFWSELVSSGIPAESYDSLRELNLAADVVVVATIAESMAGRSSCEPDGSDCTHFIDVALSVEDVIRGELPDGPLLMEKAIGGEEALSAALAVAVPEERALFFLRDQDENGRRLGWPPELIREVEGLYRWCVPQGVLREVAGITRALPSTEQPYLLRLDGEPFEEVVSGLR